MTLIIAEPGMTWDRDLDKAHKLIDAAKDAGADICKFQWTSNGKKIQERRKVDPKYAAIYEHGLQYPTEWLAEMASHCADVKIGFSCTTYLSEDIETVAPLVDVFKVSAYEATDQEFVRQHIPYNKDVIVSINPAYLPLSRQHRMKCIKLLHCVQLYPANLDELQLGRILLHDLDGFSDHSGNPMTGAIAVAAGSSIIEAHLRLDDTPKDNPDYPHSLSPADFKTYVGAIRKVERML